MSWEDELHIETQTEDEWRLTGSKRTNVEDHDPEKAGLEEGDAKFTRTFIVDMSSEHEESGEFPVTVVDSDVSVFDGELFQPRSGGETTETISLDVDPVATQQEALKRALVEECERLDDRLPPVLS